MTGPSLEDIKADLGKLETLLEESFRIRFPPHKESKKEDIDNYFKELLKKEPGKSKNEKELYEAAQSYAVVKEFKAAILMSERKHNPGDKPDQAIQNLANVYNNPHVQATIKSLSESKPKRFFTMIGHKLGIIKPAAQDKHTDALESVSKLQGDLNKAVEKQRDKNVSFIMKRR